MGKNIVIVGAGVSGLASAALLSAQGHRVSVLEKNPQVGGRAGLWESKGFKFDTGPSWYLMPEVFEHFYELMGTSVQEQLDLERLDPGYRAYFQGYTEPFELAGDDRARASLIALDPQSKDSIEDYLHSAQETYEIALERFLYGSFRSIKDFLHPKVLRQLPRLIKLLSTSLDHMIQAHTRDPRMRRVLGYPAVFLGGSPLKTPAIYHLMSHLDVNAGVFYPRGGFHKIIQTLESLATDAGADITVNADVQKICVEDSKTTGVEYLDSEGQRVKADADIVIAACDLHFVEHQLLEPKYRDHSEKWWDRGEAGPGAVLAMVGVEGKLPQLAHHTLFFADDWEKGFKELESEHLPETPSIYIGKPSQSDPDVAPADDECLFFLIPVAAQEHFGRGGEEGNGDPLIEDFVDRAIQQVSDWAGIPDLKQRIKVRKTVAPADFASTFNAWSGTALGPSHTLRQSAIFRAKNSSRKVKNLYFAGSSTIPGIGVPMCLISAELIVKELMGKKDMRALKEL